MRYKPDGFPARPAAETGFKRRPEFNPASKLVMKGAEPRNEMKKKPTTTVAVSPSRAIGPRLVPPHPHRRTRRVTRDSGPFPAADPGYSFVFVRVPWGRHQPTRSRVAFD